MSNNPSRSSSTNRSDNQLSGRPPMASSRDRSNSSLRNGPSNRPDDNQLQDSDRIANNAHRVSSPESNPNDNPAQPLSIQIEQNVLGSPLTNPFATPLEDSPNSYTTPTGRTTRIYSNANVQHQYQPNDQYQFSTSIEAFPTNNAGSTPRGVDFASPNQARVGFDDTEMSSMSIHSYASKRSDSKIPSSNRPSSRLGFKKKDGVYILKSPNHDDFVSLPIEDMVDGSGAPISLKKAKKPKKSRKRSESPSTPNSTTHSTSQLTSPDVHTIKSNGSIGEFYSVSDSHTILPDCTESPKVVYIQDGSTYRKIQGDAAIEELEKAISGEAGWNADFHQIPILSWEDQNKSLAKLIEKIAKNVFVFVQSFYAGICLVSILILPGIASQVPTTTPLATNITITPSSLGTLLTQTTLDCSQSLAANVQSLQYTFTFVSIESTELFSDPSFQFLSFYSYYAAQSSYLFSIASVFACLSALYLVDASKLGHDIFGFGYSDDSVDCDPNMKAIHDPEYGESMKNTGEVQPVMSVSYFMMMARLFSRALVNWSIILRLIIISFALISLIENALMVPNDYNIDSSHNSQFGGVFGTGYWYRDPASITASRVISELQAWKYHNFNRSLFGILCWVVCQYYNTR